jgi:peroxiredoxin
MLLVGVDAPALDLPGIGGDGNPVLLAFFKVSCPVCQYTFPFIERIAGSGNLQVIGISQDDLPETEEFRREFGLSFPIHLDEADRSYRLSNAYRITHVPSIFLVEAGKVTEAFSGFSRIDLERLGERFGVAVFQKGEKTPDFRPG